MQSLLHNITTYLLTQSTHIILLFIALAFTCFALKNKSAHLRYLLWLLLIAKCLLPSLITVPLAVLPEKQIASAAPVPPAVEYTFPPVEVPYTPAPLLPAPDIAAPAPPARADSCRPSRSGSAENILRFFLACWPFPFPYHHFNKSGQFEPALQKQENPPHLSARRRNRCNLK